MESCPVTAFASAERATPEELAVQQALFVRDRVFSELMNFIPDMVMILNSHRQIVYANRAVLKMRGEAEPGAILGLRPGELVRCVHATEAEGGCGTTEFCRFCGAVGAILQSQGGSFAVEECRISVHAGANEEALDLRVWASPMEFEGETFTFFVVVDIADEKRKVFLERIFLHDIMNTAAALKGYTQLLGAGLADEATREKFIQRISMLSIRIVDEVESHRLLVAAENNSLQVERKPLLSLSFVQEMFDTYNRPDLLDGRHLALAGDCEDLAFLTDSTLLSRVVGNMLKNAIEASLAGETVSLGCRKEGGRVAFWVHNGIYMPEKIRLQVFNRSFSTKGAGRGLGTYSMKYLTEKYLGGSIAFTTSEAEGTTFTVQMPLGLEPEVPCPNA